MKALLNNYQFVTLDILHAFEKIEQFVLTEPEKSWTEFDCMIGLSEEFYKFLRLPYRVVGIVSGELNNAAAKNMI